RSPLASASMISSNTVLTMRSTWRCVRCGFSSAIFWISSDLIILVPPVAGPSGSGRHVVIRADYKGIFPRLTNENGDLGRVDSTAPPKEKAPRNGGAFRFFRPGADGSAAILQRGAEDIPQRGARIGGTVLFHGFLLFGDLARLDRQAQLAGLRVDVGDAHVHLVADLEAFRALVAAVAAQVAAADERLLAVVIHLDPAILD